MDINPRGHTWGQGNELLDVSGGDLIEKHPPMKLDGVKVRRVWRVPKAEGTSSVDVKLDAVLLCTVNG